MDNGDVTYGLESLPEHPWDPKQFDLGVQDDVWLDRQMAELDKAVGAAVGTSGLAVLETARGVIAALRRRRSGEDEAFGEIGGPGVESTFVNERGNTITVRAERNAAGDLVRTIMIGPMSMVENIMTPKEALVLHSVLEKTMGVRAIPAEMLDAPEERSPYSLFDTIHEVASGPFKGDIYGPAEALNQIKTLSAAGMVSLTQLADRAVQEMATFDDTIRYPEGSTPEQRASIDDTVNFHRNVARQMGMREG